MAKKKDIRSGMKFGKWEIIEEIPAKISSNKPRRMFKCKCECGNIGEVQLACLLNGHSTSCGCIQKQRASEANLVHGLSDKHPLYSVWKNMKKRCNNPSATEYKNYGGRGISVCDDWQKFKPFYDWAIHNGWQSSLTIDRIDYNGNYCPENCRWATQKEQANNTTLNHYLVYNNQTFTLSTLSDYLNISYNVVRYRISNCGWSVNQLLNYVRNQN